MSAQHTSRHFNSTRANVMLFEGKFSMSPKQTPWEIPATWQWSTMGEVSTIVGGGTPNTNFPEFFDGEIPWITPADLSGYTQKYIAKGSRSLTEDGLDNSGAQLMPAGSVLFSSRAPIGYVAIAGNPLSTNQGFKSFVPYDGLASDFVYYYLQRAKQLAIDLASGTTFPEISSTKASQIPIPVAPFAEQKRIVEEIEKQFSRLDVGEAALQQAQIQLKRYRAAVLKAACEGRLVPTEAELARESDADYEPADALLTRILTERRAQWNGRGEYKEPAMPDISNLPELPEGWTWATPEQLSSADAYSLAIGPFGSNLKVSDYTDSGVPLIFVRNIRASRFGGKDSVFVSKRKAEELHPHQVTGGDILITKMGAPPGDACLYPDSEPDAVITADCIKFRLSEALSQKHFFVHAINSQVVKPQILQITKGVAQMKVSLGRFSSLGIPLPPLAEQARIVAEVDRRLSVVETLEATIEIDLRRATRFRQSILQRAFSGQLVPQNSSDEPVEVLLQRMRMQAGEASKAIPPPRKEKKKMPSKPVKSLEDILDRLDALGGAAATERLFAVSGLSTLEDGADQFFELLREGRKRKILKVPVGESGTIQRSSDED